MNECSYFNKKRNQSGAVLLMSLLILLIMTTLTLVAVSGSTTQEKVANSTRSLDLSLQAAESALRDAERNIGSSQVNNITGLPAVNPYGTGWYNYIGDKNVLDSLQIPVPKTTFWNDNTAVFNVSTDEIPDTRIISNPPRLFIEALAPIPDPGGSLDSSGTMPGITMFKITALGKSSPEEDGEAPYSVILESTFHR